MFKQRSFMLKTILSLILLSFLWNLGAQEPKLMLPIGHTDYVKLSRISPDGKRVVTMGSDNKNILWSLQTGRRLALLYDKGLDDVSFNATATRILGIEISGAQNNIPLWDYSTGALVALLQHRGGINFAQFSPDGKSIVTTSNDGTAKIWNAITGDSIRTFVSGDAILTKAGFSRDGKKIITAGSYKAMIWDVLTGNSLQEITGHSGIISDISFSPDEQKIATASYDKTVKLWDAATGRLLITYGLKESASAVSFNSTGNAIITESSDFSNNKIQLWSTKSGNLIRSLTTGNEDGKFGVFSHDGNLVASGSDNSDVKIWEVNSGKLLFTFKDHFPRPREALFTPDDSRLIVATGSYDAKIWDIQSGSMLLNIKGSSNGFNDIELSADGKRLALASDNNIQHWDLEKMVQVNELKGHTFPVEDISFTENANLIMTNNRTNSIRLWDLSKGNLLSPAIYSTSNTRPYTSVYSGSFNKFMRELKDYKTVEIWDTKKGRLQTVLDKKYSEGLTRWVFTNDEKRLITGDVDKTIKIWDTETGALIKKIALPKEASIDHLLLSSDDKKILVTDYEKNAYFLSVAGEQLAVINKMHAKTMEKPILIEDRNRLLTHTSDGSLKLWDSDNGEIVANFIGNKNSLRFYYFSPDFKRMVTSAWYEDVVRIWDIQAQKIIATLSGHKGGLWSVKISHDWKYIVSQSMEEQTIKLWDSQSGTLLRTLPGHKLRTIEVIFSPNDKFLYSRGNDGDAKKWEISTGMLLHTFSGHKEWLTTISYNDINKTLLTGSSDGTVKLWNTENGAMIKDFEGHTDRINVAKFGKIANTILTASNDNTVKMWSTASGRLLNTFFSVDETEYISRVPAGYYRSSPDAAKLLHYVTDEMKVISFEQLDVKYNRPDKVLQSVGNDTALIKSYLKAYQKRIKKLGIDTTAFREGYSVPEADFVNRNEIESESRSNNLVLHILGKDSAYKLDRFNVWVNEVPVFGQRGLSIRKKMKNVFDSSMVIKLTHGENRIETSVSNVNGTESYRIPLSVNYSPLEKQPWKVYFIGIGIDQFADSKYNLKYSTKDIRDLSNKLKEKYKDIIIDTLFNENVTISSIKALKQKLLQTTVNDKVIISYSGHGMLSKDFDYYLSTYAVNFDKPEEKGLPYDELESLLDSIPARKKLMFIDACHSGEVDKDDLVAMNELDSSRIIRGLKPVAYKQEGQLGLKNSFELMQSLFVNVGKSTGATIISAAAGTEFALEGINDLPNGVFTYCILEAMNKYDTMRISELKKIVGDRVVEITKGLQKPTSRNETIAVDWEVW